MIHVVELPSVEIDRFVRAFEAERLRSGHAEIRDFLPTQDHPGYIRVLVELLRVELECEWAADVPSRINDYLATYPELSQHPDALAQIAFEEYRQRQEHGEQPDPGEYSRRFGVDTSEWEFDPQSNPPPTQIVDVVTPNAMASSATTDQKQPQTHVGSGRLGDEPAVEKVSSNLHHSKPTDAAPLREGRVSFPKVGSDFLGFRLVSELGRGAFGRVYLAEQTELSGRQVALKVTTELTAEPQTLAQLQHTNIVPVYSVHRHGAVQAVCMPYFGATTLSDVLQVIKSGGGLPHSGGVLVSTLNDQIRTKWKESRGRPTETNERTTVKEFDVLDRPSVAIKTTDILARLGDLSYIDAILWIAARLADGLSHAHARGIIHRDLKPANVLITDEG